MAKNPEIIITFSYYGIGGAQRRAFTIANELVKNGYNVHVVAVMGNDGTIHNNFYQIDPRIKLIILPDYYTNIKNTKTIKNSDKYVDKKISLLKKKQTIFNLIGKCTNPINYRIVSLRKCKELRSFFLSHKGATILSFGFGIFDRVYFASQKLNMKIIYAETNASNKYENDRFCEFTKKYIKESAAFVFQTKEQAIDHGLEENINAHIIYNPIKQNLPDRFPGERRPVIVNFCRLSRQKNLLLLIEAFNDIKNEILDYKLEIYVDTVNSHDDEYKNQILNYILINNLKDKVFLLPPSPDIHRMIYDCSLFVSSSDYEGISNSMIEAMAIGLPCVCTDCDGGGARELIENEVNGLLVPKADKEELKKAIIRMLNDKKLSEQCSINATKVKYDLSVKKITAEWLRVIEDISNNGDIYAN